MDTASLDSQRQDVKVVGIYPIEAPEPCHLIEVILPKSFEEVDFGEFTQETPGEPKENWQVAYDEQVLEDGAEESRSVFFFHYLDCARPLLTPCGPVDLPEPTPMPERLSHIEYWEP